MPLPEYKANLNTFVDRLQELGAQVVIITPPPVDEAARIKLAKQVHHTSHNDPTVFIINHTKQRYVCDTQQRSYQVNALCEEITQPFQGHAVGLLEDCISIPLTIAEFTWLAGWGCGP